MTSNFFFLFSFNTLILLLLDVKPLKEKFTNSSFKTVFLNIKTVRGFGFFGQLDYLLVKL